MFLVKSILHLPMFVRDHDKEFIIFYYTKQLSVQLNISNTFPTFLSVLRSKPFLAKLTRDINKLCISDKTDHVYVIQCFSFLVGLERLIFFLYFFMPPLGATPIVQCNEKSTMDLCCKMII